MTREEIQVTGNTHDHPMVGKYDDNNHDRDSLSYSNSTTSTTASVITDQARRDAPSSTSTIAILKRHPMYDCLVLVKKYRRCLHGYSLEFPTSNSNNEQYQEPQDCCRTKLVSIYLDGDDPIYQCQDKQDRTKILSQDGEVVYVPMNGLLDRLNSYDRNGVSIDSRVYAFAMGLKISEKKLVITSSMREVQETPTL